MRTRRETLLWMKDLIDHMARCHDQLQWVSDGATDSFLTDAMMVDLSECRRLCEQLQPEPRRSRLSAPAASPA